MDNRRKRKQKEIIVPGLIKDQYEQKRIFATASDGSSIPISLVYKISLRDPNGGNPCLLYGYGAYGDLKVPSFSAERLSLLDRGFIFAIAHIRGDATMGWHWYEDGKLLKKKNTFTDFIACAEHLVNEAYTTVDKLAIHGRSAGGLLIGAVVNMRPDLFKLAIADVPFMDVIGSMIDSSIPVSRVYFL
jgi:oligopeptidase B